MSSNLKTTIKISASLVVIALMQPICMAPAHADPQGDCSHCEIDYSKVRNLSSEQQSKIEEFDQEWLQEYQRTQPEIQILQQRFKELLASPSADSTEIMRVQQEIDQKRSSLKSKATQVLLKKRRVLTAEQNKDLDGMIREEILKRRQSSQGKNVVPVRWQKLLNNIQNIFPQNQPE